MTDLHTHILPGLDDGARDVHEALRLLGLERAQGVSALVCTPHCDLSRESLPAFCKRRAGAALALGRALRGAQTGVDIRLGAELRLDPCLLGLDPAPLCFSGTRVLLVEMPWDLRPIWDVRVLEHLVNAGFVPLVAHVERYPYVKRHPQLVEEWRKAGALLQVNAASLTERSPRGQLAMALVRAGRAAAAASDTHSPLHRPPNLREAMAHVARTLGPGAAQQLEAGAAALFAGKRPG